MVDDRIFVGGTKHGTFATVPDVLRLSTTLKRLRSQADGEAAAVEIEALYERVGNLCTIHGRLDDPIIGILEGQVAFCCPDCSAPEMKAAWEKEGRNGGS